MEFRQLEAFVNAVKYKSFSRAADATFLSQPTISAHVSNLESELGVLLFHRNGREITLTPQGREFYPYATSLLNTRAKALLSVHGGSGELSGILDIQTSTIPGQYLLPRLMKGFHEKNPKVRFYVEQSDSRNVNENLLNQKGELGFTGYKGNSGLAYEPVFTDDMVLITPDEPCYADYKNGDKMPAEMFLKCPFILREEGSGTKEEMEKALVDGKAVFKNVAVVARMNHMETIKQAVSLGLGVSIVSELAVRHCAESEGLRYFKIEGLKKKRIFYLTYNKNRCLSPAAEEFLTFVKREARAVQEGSFCQV